MSPVNPRAGRPRRRAIAAVRASGAPCHICGLPIDLTLDPIRHPLASTVDELVPLRFGGDPLDPANIAHSHRTCNSARGARPITPELQARCRALVLAHLERQNARAVVVRPW